jgi:hypothetical protein
VPVVSWFLIAVPAHHALSGDGVLDTWRGLERTHGLPEEVPAARPFPLAREVLAAFGASACHGDAWTTVTGVNVADWLPPCPDQGECGMYVGEVTLRAVGEGRDPERVLSLETPVQSVGFRKPDPRAVLRLACALAVPAGGLLVFDDGMDAACVVQPGERPDDLAPHWPWLPAAGQEGAAA